MDEAWIKELNQISTGKCKRWVSQTVWWRCWHFVWIPKKTIQDNCTEQKDRKKAWQKPIPRVSVADWDLITRLSWRSGRKGKISSFPSLPEPRTTYHNWQFSPQMFNESVSSQKVNKTSNIVLRIYGPPTTELVLELFFWVVEMSFLFYLGKHEPYRFPGNTLVQLLRLSNTLNSAGNYGERNCGRTYNLHTEKMFIPKSRHNSLLCPLCPFCALPAAPQNKVIKIQMSFQKKIYLWRGDIFCHFNNIPG